MDEEIGFWIGGGVIIVALLSLFFVNRASEDTVLAKKIFEVIEKGNSEIFLSDLTDFSWEQAQIYGPYTTKEVIEESLNVKFKGSVKGIDYREDIFLLVFAKGDYAVKTVVLPRKQGYFTAKNGILTPENDLLVNE